MAYQTTHKTYIAAHTSFMENEAKENTRNIGKIAVITLAVYAGIRWLVPLFLPFLTAFLLAKLINPMVEKMEQKFRLKRTFWSSLLVSILMASLVLVTIFFLKTLVDQIGNVAENLDLYRQQAEKLWQDCCCQVETFAGIAPGTIQDSLEKQLPKIIDHLHSNFFPAMMNETISYAKSMFILIGICFIVVISTVLILKDYKKIRSGLEKNPIGKAALQVCRRTYAAGGAYLKSQLIILVIITIICVAGLYLSGNKYALLTGCGIGICDAMPFLGTGTVFVPWALFEVIQGKYMLASIYAAIYTICTLIREILEPKLLGNKLGMPPLTVIISMFVGLKIYGLWGFVLGPLSYILIKEIYLTT